LIFLKLRKKELLAKLSKKSPRIPKSFQEAPRNEATKKFRAEIQK